MSDNIQAKTIAFLACLLLAGCGAKEIPIERTDAPVTERYMMFGAGVTVFRLKDGTRCVMLYAGGVDCDWDGERNVRN